MTPFGQKIRDLRAEKGLNQKQMAQDLGVSPAYLSALEHGHRGAPTWAMVQRVISYFSLIWDDAEEIEQLARLSHPRITLDTSGLPSETVTMVNRLSQKIRSLSLEDVKAISDLIEGSDNSKKP